MRSTRIALSVLVLCCCALPALAQVKVRVDESKEGFSLETLRGRTVRVPGLGEDVPGVEYDRVARVRHVIGPASEPASRAAVDSAWAPLKDSRDSVVPGLGQHWLRITLRPAEDLRGVPLLMSVGARRNIEVYFNGRFLMRSAGRVFFPADSATDADDAVRLLVPFTLACDGRPEVIALRISGEKGKSLKQTGFEMTLHEGGLFYMQQRRMMHYGIFIGINLVILLFAWVMWGRERRERVWLLVALLALVSVLGTYAKLGADMGVLGVGGGPLKVLEFVQLVLLPWPFYLLTRIMGLLHGGEKPQWRRWFGRGAVAASLIMAAFAAVVVSGPPTGIVMDSWGWPQWTAAGVLLALLIAFGLVMAWIILVTVRRGFQLVRAKGPARWVGAGALISLLLSLVIETAGALVKGGLARWLDLLGDYCSFAAVPLCMAVFLAVRAAYHNRLVARQRDELDAEVRQRTIELQAEKERSDELLLNILPAEVAAELKEKGRADARLMERVTVLFTDFKDFSSFSQRLRPEDLIADIHECFSAFDGIMERHGVEKIKTIGDAYMAAGGLPVPNTTHARDTVLAALEVQAFIAERKERLRARGAPWFDIRIGVHTGPVVAGIVGVKKFQYDIWGDTVNTASRMETSGEPGKVNISAGTHALLRDDPAFRFTPRGPVEVKGLGVMEMYFVERAG